MNVAELNDKIQFEFHFLPACRRAWSWSYNSPWLEVSVLTLQKPRDIMFTMPIAKLPKDPYFDTQVNG